MRLSVKRCSCSDGSCTGLLTAQSLLCDGWDSLISFLSGVVILSSVHIEITVALYFHFGLISWYHLLHIFSPLNDGFFWFRIVLLIWVFLDVNIIKHIIQVGWHSVAYLISVLVCYNRQYTTVNTSWAKANTQTLFQTLVSCYIVSIWRHHRPKDDKCWLVLVCV